MTEDIGDAPITVQIISGELADGVSVDIFFSNQNVTAFGKRLYKNIITICLGVLRSEVYGCVCVHVYI